MKITDLYELAPWEWPKERVEIILEALNDPTIDLSERLKAVEMAGDFVVINDQLAKILIAMVIDNNEEEELRSSAAIALGVALEHGYIFEFKNPDDILLSEGVFGEVTSLLRQTFSEPGVPKQVRRSVLEASVRSPQEWHRDAITNAYESDDPDWQLTAVFCMRFVKGFERQILQSLKSDNQDIFYQAIYCAGNWGIKDAWPYVAFLLEPDNDDEELLLAAIAATASIGVDMVEANECLLKLLGSDNDEVVDAVYEALAMVGIEDLEDYDMDEDGDSI